MATVEHEHRVLQPKPAEVDEVGKVLLRAADLIRERKWGQGYSWHRGRDSVCVVQALHLVNGGWRAQKWLANSLGIEVLSVVAWNDAPGRTKEEVIEALERAAYGV